MACEIELETYLSIWRHRLHQVVKEISLTASVAVWALHQWNLLKVTVQSFSKSYTRFRQQLCSSDDATLVTGLSEFDKSVTETLCLFNSTVNLTSTDAVKDKLSIIQQELDDLIVKFDALKNCCKFLVHAEAYIEAEAVPSCFEDATDDELISALNGEVTNTVPFTNIVNRKDGPSLCANEARNMPCTSHCCVFIEETANENVGNRCTFSLCDFPDELLEIIFEKMPLADTLLCINCVCKRFHNVVSRSGFLKWRKYYYMLKCNESSMKKGIGTWLEKVGMNNSETFFLKLLKHVSLYKPKLSAVEQHLLEEEINGHYLNGAALDCLHELSALSKHPELFLQENVWIRIALIFLLTDSALSLTSFLRRLTKIVLSRNVTELCYQLTFFLVAGRQKFGISPRQHYNIFYALRLLESDLERCNDATTTSGLQLSEEQRRVVGYDLKQNEVVKIVALAGTGKTSTLAEYCRRRPSEKFLIIFYNKSAEQHARKMFPSNACCRTIHSIAYEEMGISHNEVANLRVSAVISAADELKNHPIKGYANAAAALVVKTLNGFMSSSDNDLQLCHVPIQRTMQNTLQTLGENYRNEVLEYSHYMWQKIVDRAPGVKMPHDGYLKLYQLERRKFRVYFNAIFVDEAQDCSPATLAIILNQNGPKIFVGDPHQQIYSFRKAVNALQKLEATKAFTLTRSFRFGPEIAYVANCCLEVLKGEEKITLVGTDNHCQLYIPTGGNAATNKSGAITTICRLNSTVFSVAAELAELPTKPRLYIVGRPEDRIRSFKRLLDIYTLSLPSPLRKRKIDDVFIKKFDDLMSLEQYAKNTDDNDLLVAIQIVKSHKQNTEKHVSMIESCLVASMHDADYIVTTAHKSKGLEFCNVRIADDFVFGDEQLFRLDPRNTRETALFLSADESDERNLLYVAVTRAKHSLSINPVLHNMLGRNCQDYFEVLMPAECAVLKQSSAIIPSNSPSCSLSSNNCRNDNKKRDNVDAECTEASPSKKQCDVVQGRSLADLPSFSCNTVKAESKLVDVSLICTVCKHQFSCRPSQLIMYRKPVSFSFSTVDDVILKQGPVCFYCGTGQNPLFYRFFGRSGFGVVTVATTIQKRSYGIFHSENTTSIHDFNRLSLRPLLLGKHWLPIKKDM